MARVPRLEIGARLPSQGPGVAADPRSISTITLPFQRLGRIGEGIADDAARTLERQRRQAEAEAKEKDERLRRLERAATVNRAVAELSTEWLERSLNFENEASDGAPGHTLAVTRSIDDDIKKRLAGIDDPETRLALENSLGALKVNFAERALKFEAGERVSYGQSVTVDALGKMRSLVEADPSMKDTALVQGRAMIADMAPALGPALTRKLLKDYEQDIAVAELMPALRSDPAGVLNKLIGGGPVSEDDAWTAGVVAAEGSQSHQVSPKGAAGRMQVMPATAREIAAELGEHDVAAMSDAEIQKFLADDANGMRYGKYYLNKMRERYDNNPVLVFAAYNAGPGRVDQWIKRYGDPRTGEVSQAAWAQKIPIEETRNYVPRALEAARTSAGEFSVLTTEKKESLIRQGLAQLQRQQAERERLERAQERQRKQLGDSIAKSFSDLMLKGELTLEMVQRARPVLEPKEYEGFLIAATKPGGTTDSMPDLFAIEGRLQNGEDIQRDLNIMLDRGLITQETWTRYSGVNRQLKQSEGMDTPYKRFRSYVKESLNPGQYGGSADIPARRAQQRALLDFDAWVQRNPNADADAMEAQATKIINSYHILNLDTMTTAVGRPRFAPARAGDPTPEDLGQAAQQATEAFASQRLSEGEYAREMEAIAAWQTYLDNKTRAATQPTTTGGAKKRGQ